MTMMITLFVSLLTTTNLLFAETAINNAQEAYQREMSYLSAQKNSLASMKVQLLQQHEGRKSKALATLKSKQTGLVLLQTKNQDLYEEYKDLEKMKKENYQISTQLEKNALKISDHLLSIRSKIGLPYDEPEGTDGVKKFESLLSLVHQTIIDLSTPTWRSHAFLDENEKLIQGDVLFWGLFSAWGKTKGDDAHSIKALTPFGQDFLKVLSGSSGDEVVFFTADFDKLPLLTSKTWRESLADLIPGLVMGLIMMTVFGLFIMLAKA